MTKLTIINDTHLGVTRTSGTMKESAIQLQVWMLRQFDELLDQSRGSDLLINGDQIGRAHV